MFGNPFSVLCLLKRRQRRESQKVVGFTTLIHFPKVITFRKSKTIERLELLFVGRFCLNHNQSVGPVSAPRAGVGGWWGVGGSVVNSDVIPNLEWFSSGLSPELTAVE